MEKDAVRTNSEKCDNYEVIEVIESQNNNQMALSPILNMSSAVTNHNMLVSNQSLSTNLTFERCSGITLGNQITIDMSRNEIAPWNKNGTVKTIDAEDESYITKTPTISKMLKSIQPIPVEFLDCVSKNLGHRWREVPVLLNIDSLFVQLQYEDHFDKGGIKEVVFQVLSHYFQNNENKSTIGWLVNFLWRNGFRKTVWNVRETYKFLQEMDS
ncbi:unnamed protein product [Diamesa tonsa]